MIDIPTIPIYSSSTGSFGTSRYLPSLDLQFATDKTLTARRGPTPVFTRLSGATQINAAGLIEYAPENLVLRSEEFNNATWDKTTSPANWQGTGSAPAVTANDGISPRGDLTAERIVLTLNDGTSSNDRSGFSQVLSATVGVNYSVSVYVKPLDSTTDLQLINSNIGIATFGTILTRTVVDAGSGWKRIITTYVATSTFGTFRFQIVGGSGINQFTGLIWGAQLERHTSARDYIPTTAAAVYGPRFDHDPVTLACRGLLIEESRTNLATYSEDFSLGFAIERASIDPNIATAPNGSTTADKLIEDTTPSNNHRLTRIVNLSAIPYTFSVFAKASERSWIRLTLFDNVTARQVWFDVSAGVIGTQSGAIGQIVSFGNGWWRCSITATGLASIYSQANIALATADNILAYTGDGTSGLFLWGAQLETGSFPTSYIPTTTATVPRSADVCSITGSDFTSFYNQSEGTVSLQATSLMATATAGNRTFLSFTDGGYTNQQGIYKTVNSSNLNTPIGSGVGTAVGTITQGVAFKVAVALQPSNSAASFNGGAAATVSSAAVVGINRLEFRDPTGAPGGHPSCHIARIQYFRKRLPNAKLQSLTTP